MDSKQRLLELRYSTGMNRREFAEYFDIPFTRVYNVDDMITYADGKSQICDTLREGVVIRNYDKNISFKCISNKFLLKHNI